MKSFWEQNSICCDDNQVLRTLLKSRVADILGIKPDCGRSSAFTYWNNLNLGSLVESTILFETSPALTPLGSAIYYTRGELSSTEALFRPRSEPEICSFKELQDGVYTVLVYRDRRVPITKVWSKTKYDLKKRSAKRGNWLQWSTLIISKSLHSVFHKGMSKSWPLFAKRCGGPPLSKFFSPQRIIVNKNICKYHLFSRDDFWSIQKIGRDGNCSISSSYLESLGTLLSIKNQQFVASGLSCNGSILFLHYRWEGSTHLSSGSCRSTRLKTKNILKVS